MTFYFLLKRSVSLSTQRLNEDVGFTESINVLPKVTGVPRIGLAISIVVFEFHLKKGYDFMSKLKVIDPSKLEYIYVMHVNICMDSTMMIDNHC